MVGESRPLLKPRGGDGESWGRGWRPARSGVFIKKRRSRGDTTRDPNRRHKGGEPLEADLGNKGDTVGGVSLGGTTTPRKKLGAEKKIPGALY